jgi:hypothetical protein
MKMNQKLVNEVKSAVLEGYMLEEKFQEIAEKVTNYLEKLNSDKYVDLIDILMDEDYFLTGYDISVNTGSVELNSKYGWEDLDQDTFYYSKYTKQDGKLVQTIEDLTAENIEKVMRNIEKNLKVRR